MLERIISGGQTGADQAGWRAAKAAGIATGGWMPRGFLTEDGPRPEFAERYGATEADADDFPTTAGLNVEQADVTLWFGDQQQTPRAYATYRACVEKGKLFLAISGPTRPRPAFRADELRELGPHRVINVAGDPESKAPGIGE